MSRGAGKSHPHIVQTEGVCGGAPRIRETRISVWEIAALFREGEPLEEIAALYRHVDPEAIRGAPIGYSCTRQEVHSQMEANRLETVLSEAEAVLGEDGVIRFASVRND